MGKAAGVISIILAVGSGVAGILSYVNHHTRRGPAFLIACAVLLVLGVFLLVFSSRKPKPSP
jgi:hypothetical protein